MAYICIYESTNPVGSIMNLVCDVLNVTIEDNPDGGYWISYQLKYTAPNNKKYSYSDSFTKTEALKHFCKSEGKKIAERNGYRFFKEV